MIDRSKQVTVKMVPLSSLKPHPSNPRRHDRGEIDALKASILQYGFTEPCIRQMSSGLIVAGAGRIQAATELAAEGKLDAVEFTPGVRLNGCLPVVDKRLTDRQALAYCIADNRLTERGTWDFPLLKDILITDLGLTADVASFDLPVGFDLPELQSLEGWTGKGDPLRQNRGKPGLTDDDAVPASAPARTKLGDVWLCGKHRVMCGDSTKPEDVARLMKGGKAVLFATDPPYGCNAGNIGFTAQRDDIEAITKDDLEGREMQAFLERCFRAWIPTLTDNAAWYLWHPMLTQGYFAAAAAAADLIIHRQIIWRKEQFIFGRGDYHWRHELCFYGWRKGHRPAFYGERNQDTVWDVPWGEKRGKVGHPTAKPVSLFAIPVLNHTKLDAICADPFLGSGTTLIACEKLGRVCFGCDIEPKYVSVAVKRWQDFTGRKATLESTGETFDLAAKRGKRA